MNGALGHNSVLQGYTVTRTISANEMNIGVNHAPGAGLLLRKEGSIETCDSFC